MNKLVTVALPLCLLHAISITAWGQQDAEPGRTIGSIELLDPAASQWIDPDAQIEVLATGFEWSEGPAWVKQGGYLVFSDVPRNTVYKWAEGEGLSKYLQPSGYTGGPSDASGPGSNGLAIDRSGHLLLCQHGDHALARMDAPLDAPEPQYTPLASEYQGQALNSPNDLAVHSSGAIYFTDPPYGRKGAFHNPDRELDFQGVYRVVPGESPQLLTKELKAPNGIALSPDEKTLYIAQSDPEHPLYMAYPVKADGTLGEGRVLLDVKQQYDEEKGSPDGMAIDTAGNLWATGPGGVLVVSPAGKILARIRTGEPIANCKFGDDGSTLYMTSDMHLCRVKTKTKGVGF